MSYEPPLKITIPIPSEIPIGRGTNSTGKRGGNLRIRCTNKEYDAIQREATELGLSLAMFCRWSIVHVASGLFVHREVNSTLYSVEVENELKPRRKK
jgi:hypothetical protein